MQLHKPVKASELTQTIGRLLSISPSVDHAATPAKTAIGGPLEASRPGSPVIFVVDDDNNVRAGIRSMLKADGKVVEDYASAEAFLAAYKPGRDGCLLVDAYLPGMSGLQLLQRVHEHGHQLPAIMITGSSDVPTAVEAMKAGALDFIEKPISHGDLLDSIHRALEQSRIQASWRRGARRRPPTSRTSPPANARSWSWYSRGTPARTSLPILASANARSRTIVPRS